MVLRYTVDVSDGLTRLKCVDIWAAVRFCGKSVRDAREDVDVEANRPAAKSCGQPAAVAQASSKRYSPYSNH